MRVGVLLNLNLNEELILKKIAEITLMTIRIIPGKHNYMRSKNFFHTKSIRKKL